MGEWLLGNQPLSELPSLVLLAPMYCGGAVLVREVGRRTRSGWPAMALLTWAQTEQFDFFASPGSWW